MKQFQKLVLALSLSLAAACSHAADQSFDIGLLGDPAVGMTAGLSSPDGTAVNHTLSGSFTDTFVFNTFNGTGLIDIWLDTSVSKGNEATQQIVFTSAMLNGVPLAIDDAFTSGNTIFRSAELFQQLTNGPLTLIVNGYAGILNDPGRQISASYSGGINVSPVPEPAPAVLLLAGLGAVGVMVRRRVPR